MQLPKNENISFMRIFCVKTRKEEGMTMHLNNPFSRNAGNLVS
jgi:hypothetical protein